MHFSSKSRAHALALSLVGLAALFGGCPAAPGGPGTIGPDGGPLDPVPVLETIAPQKGSVYGGTSLVIKGTGFQANDQITVGGINCSPFKLISDGEIHCLTSAHAAGASDVLILRKGVEQSKLAGGFAFGCVDTGATGLTVWANDGGDKVTRDELRGKCDPESIKSAIWSGTSINLFSAKNEVVNFNLVIEAASQAASGLSVKFDTLTGPGGSVIHSNPTTGDGVFTWTDRNIELFYIRYLQIKGLSRISYGVDDERQIPKRFERPWVGTGVGQGTWTDRPDHDKYYPDIAVPLESKPTFDIASAQNQSIWADIYVPETATAGTYTGTVSVMQGSAHVADVPVNLTVRGFALPNIPTSKTMVYAGYLDLAKRYLGVNYTDHNTTGPQLDKIRDRIFMVAHRHKISLIDQDFGPDVWNQDNPHPVWLPRLSGSLFTAANGYAGPGVSKGNNIYAIGVYNTWNWSGGTEQDMWNHTNSWESWFQANSPSTERFLFLSDEPSSLTDTQKWATWMKANPGPGSSLRSFTATLLQNAVASNGAPAVDVVASLLSVGDPATWENALARLRTNPKAGFYCYNGKRPASGSFATEDDGVALRELPWGQFKKGIDRWFYWESGYYTNQQGAQGAVNVFENAQTFGGAPQSNPLYGVTSTGSPYGNGDGVLFYPGTDQVFPADSYGLAGPIVSLRLKQWRRGIQDVDYLAMAKAKDPAAAQAIINEMVPKAMWETGVDNVADPTYAHAPISWSTDPADWEAARAKLAHIIDGN